MTTRKAAAQELARNINQEERFHELEKQHLKLKHEFTSTKAALTALESARTTSLDDVIRMQTQLDTKDTELLELKQELRQIKSERDLAKEEKVTISNIADRRAREMDQLNETLKQRANELKKAQEYESDAVSRALTLQHQKVSLEQAMQRLTHTNEELQTQVTWYEGQLGEKNNKINELRRTIATTTHTLDTLRAESTEECTDLKHQLEGARSTTKRLETTVIHVREQLKEAHALAAKKEESFRNELQAQQRLATLYKEASTDAQARLTTLQERCDELRKALSASEEALSEHSERTKADVEHLFEEQAKASEDQIAQLQAELTKMKEKMEEMETKQTTELQTTAVLHDLSPTVGEMQLAVQGLSTKQLYDRTVKLEAALRREQQDKNKLQLYMDRLVKEVQAKAPVLSRMRQDHERALASHTLISERLEVCLHERTQQQARERELQEEVKKSRVKCNQLTQHVEDLASQIQHLLFREHKGKPLVTSENLVVFQDVADLQKRNQQLLMIVRELTDTKAELEGSNVTLSIQNGDIDVGKRLELVQEEMRTLQKGREEDRLMIQAIVKQRDMYRVLLAQADSHYSLVEGEGKPLLTSGKTTLALENGDDTPVKKLKDLQLEFETYKKEKRLNRKMLQESLDESLRELSEAKFARVQAQVEASSMKERWEASEQKREECITELANLRSKVENFNSKLLAHEKALTEAEATVEAKTSEVILLQREKDSAERSLKFFKTLESKQSEELTSLRIEQSKLVSLLESTRQLEATRETREQQTIAEITNKLKESETLLADARTKREAIETRWQSEKLALELDKKMLSESLEEQRAAYATTREEVIRLREQSINSEKEHSRLLQQIELSKAQLKKGATVVATEQVASLEIQVHDLQQQIQSAELEQNSLTDQVAKYKTIAEVHEENYNSLKKSSDSLKLTHEKEEESLKTQISNLKKALDQAQAEAKSLSQESDRLRDEMETIETNSSKRINDILDKQKYAEIQMHAAQSEQKQLAEQVKVLQEELSNAQANYERELQLHADDVAKWAPIRQRTPQNSMLPSSDSTQIEKQLADAMEEKSILEKRIAELLETNKKLVEQNSLLHAQFKHATEQVSRLQLVSSTNSQESAEVDVDKQVQELQQVITYLRSEYEIATSKDDLSRQENRRLQTQIVSLEAMNQHLRSEIENLEKHNTKEAIANASHKRLAQLDQLNLLRESNATLRDEQMKTAELLKVSENKVQDLQNAIEPLRIEKATLKGTITSLESDINVLKNANERWKRRVEQLVEKCEQVDPAEYERVCAERDSLTEKVKLLESEITQINSQVTNLVSKEGQALEDEKKKVEEWKVQYERIKGFAKSWKTKAEAFRQQVTEKMTEVDAQKAIASSFEQKVKTLESQELQRSKQMKDLQEAKERFEAEAKKTTQLKDFNARLLAGLKNLKKENSELKLKVGESSSGSNTQTTLNIPEITQGPSDIANTTVAPSAVTQTAVTPNAVTQPEVTPKEVSPIEGASSEKAPNDETTTEATLTTISDASNELVAKQDPPSLQLPPSTSAIEKPSLPSNNNIETPSQEQLEVPKQDNSQPESSTRNMKTPPLSPIQQQSTIPAEEEKSNSQIAVGESSENKDASEQSAPQFVFGSVKPLFSTVISGDSATNAPVAAPPKYNFSKEYRTKQKDDISDDEALKAGITNANSEVQTNSTISIPSFPTSNNPSIIAPPTFIFPKPNEAPAGSEEARRSQRLARFGQEENTEESNELSGNKRPGVFYTNTPRKRPYRLEGRPFASIVYIEDEISTESDLGDILDEEDGEDEI